MKPTFLLFAASLLLAATSPTHLSAQEEDQAAIEAKLRESLRGSMLQLRNTEAERARLDAELQALKVQSERQIKELAADITTSSESRACAHSAARRCLATTSIRAELSTAITPAGRRRHTESRRRGRNRNPEGICPWPIPVSPG